MAITRPIVPTAEVQQIAVNATGGTFTITWNGSTTTALAFNATGATISGAMDLITDDAGDCVVTGGPGNAGGTTPYVLTWLAAKGNVPAVTTGAGSLTGGAGTATVSTTTAGVSALADPWLSVGAHSSPTHPIPDQGDWQWGMMEVAAWMAGESWSSEPANVSPVIAAAGNAFNDMFGDDIRQELKAYLAVAPAGVIDTVAGGKETAREWMVVDWLVRTLVPLWLDSFLDDDGGVYDLTDVAAASADIAALPALAVGTFDETATLDALEAAMDAVRAYRKLTYPVEQGGSRWRHSSLTSLYVLLEDEWLDGTLGQWHGAPLSLDSDPLGEHYARSLVVGEQVSWDIAVQLVPSAVLTGRTDDLLMRRGGSYVPGLAFMLLREILWAGSFTAAVAGAVAATGADSTTATAGWDEMYEEAITAGLAMFTLDDTVTSVLDLFADLCAY